MNSPSSIVLVVDDSLTSTGITSNDTVRPIATTLKMVKSTGYGVAAPSLKDMKLDSPEIIKQGTRYGVKLKAVASSIHLLKVDVESSFEPIIGTELQSKELITKYTTA